MAVDTVKRIRKIRKISRKTGRRISIKPRVDEEAITSKSTGGSGRRYENLPSHIREATGDYVVRLFGKWDPQE